MKPEEEITGNTTIKQLEKLNLAARELLKGSVDSKTAMEAFILIGKTGLKFNKDDRHRKGNSNLFP
jgi:hypothetical protein